MKLLSINAITRIMKQVCPNAQVGAGVPPLFRDAAFEILLDLCGRAWSYVDVSPHRSAHKVGRNPNQPKPCSPPHPTPHHRTAPQTNSAQPNGTNPPPFPFPLHLSRIPTPPTIPTPPLPTYPVGPTRSPSRPPARPPTQPHPTPGPPLQPPGHRHWGGRAVAPYIYQLRSTSPSSRPS